MTGELVFMCADTGSVVLLSQARIAVFLSSGETLWGVPPSAGGGRSQVRLSAMCALFTAPAHVVRGEPVRGRQVPVSLAVTVEPAGVAVTLPGSEAVVVARVSGSLGVGSVLYRLNGSGWVSSAVDSRYGCRARAVFQDRSAAFLGTDTEAALMRHTEIRTVPVHELVVGGPALGSAHTLRWSPASIAGELRDTSQYLTYAEPAPGGDGWRWWSATPFVFVRSGVTGLGLVERTVRARSAHAARPAAGLPDPY